MIRRPKEISIAKCVRGRGEIISVADTRTLGAILTQTYRRCGVFAVRMSVRTDRPCSCRPPDTWPVDKLGIGCDEPCRLDSCHEHSVTCTSTDDSFVSNAVCTQTSHNTDIMIFTNVVKRNIKAPRRTQPRHYI